MSAAARGLVVSAAARGLVVSAATRAVAVGAVGTALVVGAAGSAAAHDRLIAASPADGAVLRSAPRSIDLVFDDPLVAMGSEVVVTGPGGGNVVGGALELVDAQMSQPLPPGLPAGRYAVLWRATSSDGHPISGASVFTVAEAADAGTTVAAGSPTPAGAAPESSPASSPGAAGPPDPSAPGWPVPVAALGVVGVGALLLRRGRHSS